MKIGVEKFLVISSFVLALVSLVVAIVCAVQYPDDIECSVSYDAGVTLTDEQL